MKLMIKKWFLTTVKNSVNIRDEILQSMSVGAGVVNGPRAQTGQGERARTSRGTRSLALDPEGLCLQPQDQGKERGAVGARPDV